MVLVMDAKPKPSIRNYIAERIGKGLCLIPGCGLNAAKRGVCTKHYQQFRALLVSKSGEEQVKFEMKQIRAGRILASNHGRPKDHVNAYAETA